MTERLYIQVRDNAPYEHPVTESNLRMIFPYLDPENPPQGFEKFIRNATPAVGPFDVYEGTEYRKIDGIYQDFHVIRPMSAAEKANKISAMRESFPYANTWTLNETTGDWTAPKPYPNVPGKYYTWDENTMDWVEMTLPTPTGS